MACGWAQPRTVPRLQSAQSAQPRRTVRRHPAFYCSGPGFSCGPSGLKAREPGPCGDATALTLWVDCRPEIDLLVRRFTKYLCTGRPVSSSRAFSPWVLCIYLIMSPSHFMSIFPIAAFRCWVILVPTSLLSGSQFHYHFRCSDH